MEEVNIQARYSDFIVKHKAMSCVEQVLINIYTGGKIDLQY